MHYMNAAISFIFSISGFTNNPKLLRCGGQEINCTGAVCVNFSFVM